jgi:hypothetical protein
MSVDTRAYAWCNLGPLAEGTSSIADSHVQGSGVITCKGTINLSGIHRPAPGTVVELAYSDGQNWIARIPRRLLVLSSFANPLGGKTTSVSVGCDLAYFDARKKPPDTLTTREANPDTPEAVWRAAAPAIPASWLVGQILAALGLTAAGSIPLTNHYTRQEFDLTAGYVEELGKLAQSEGYAVRMNPAGLVEFINKAPGETGTGVLLSEEDLIDLNPINTGDLSGDAVYAKYTSLKLVAPSNPDDDQLKKRNWEQEVTISAPQQHIHQWTEYVKVPQLNADGSLKYVQRKDGAGQPVFWTSRSSVFNGVETTVITGKVMDQAFETKAYQLTEAIGYITRTTVQTTYDSWDRVKLRTTETLGLWGLEYSETAYFYSVNGYGKNKPDNYSDILYETTAEWSALAPLKTSVGYQQSYSDLRGGGLGYQYQSGYRRTDYEKDTGTGITKTVTTSYVPFISTPNGSEAISRLRDAGNQVDGSRLDYILTKAKQLVSAGSETRISTSREFGLQKRPSEAERTAAANQKAPSVETTSTMTWAMGSATSQTAIELSPPYVPDDRIVYSGGANGTYSVVKSNADQMALHFARTENRLLLGHRNGNGIQVLPEMLPLEPMGPVYIRLNGCTAAFRVNGTTYNIDPQGVTATTDALFWGAVDGIVADTWFPLPPGASSLPSTVAVTTNASPTPANAIAIPSGFNPGSPNLAGLFASLPTAQAPVFTKTVTPGALLRPYSETVDLAAGSGSGAMATAYPWINRPAVEVFAGGGSGVFAQARLLRVATFVGGGSGAIASLSARMVPTGLLGGSGSGAIASLAAPISNIPDGSRLRAGSGSGAIANLLAASTPACNQPPYNCSTSVNPYCVTNFTEAWRCCDSITSFPLLNTSSGTNFTRAWQYCSVLTTFALINTSSGTNFTAAWQYCGALSSFPLLNTGAGTNFSSAWNNCYGLTSFPSINTSNGTNFNFAWDSCSGLTSFPALNMSSGTNFANAWSYCTNLVTFPANMFNTCASTNFSEAWIECALSQASVDNILVSINAAGQSNGTLDIWGGTSSPPSQTGAAAKTALQNRGWTVYTN